MSEALGPSSGCHEEYIDKKSKNGYDYLHSLLECPPSTVGPVCHNFDGTRSFRYRRRNEQHRVICEEVGIIVSSLRYHSMQ